jgi:hypothetical protein
MRVFDVNNDAVIQLSANLERMHKSAFPSAIRNTLNNAAFETKKNVPLIAAGKFITRQKSFFKKFTTVDKAGGWDVNKMVATVGIDSRQNREVAENLESQEFGGMVRGKKLIPHDDSRVSKSQSKRVSSRNHLNKVKVHDATRAFKAHRGTRGSKFVAAVMSTAKSGKKHMMLKTGNKGMVYEVTSISRNIKTKKLKFKVKKLYSVRNTKTHSVKATGFMKKSANLASKEMNRFFKENAEFQFKKQLKR